jgi:xylulokinase
MRGNGRPSAARHPALLGIDLAGDSVTSVVTDLTGRVLATAGTRVVLSRPRPGRVEADPLDWLAATIVTVRRAVDEAGVRPQAIGLSGQMHGLVLVDAAGQTVRPAILRPDARAVLRLAAYRNLPDRIRRGLVNPLSPVMAGPMLSWIAAHEPGSYARARWALQPKDWLRAQLTGDYCTDPSDASATLLYDLLAEEWSVGAAERLGLDPGRLPAILPGAGHQAGLLTRSGADLIGLRPGTPVAAGAARTAAAVLGAGLADGSSAQVVLGPGTHVVAALRGLPASLPLTGETHIHRAATDHGWCITASVADHGRHLTQVAGAARPGRSCSGPSSTSPPPSAPWPPSPRCPSCRCAEPEQRTRGCWPSWPSWSTSPCTPWIPRTRWPGPPRCSALEPPAC